MKTRFEKISDMILDKTQNFEYFEFHIMDWSNKLYKDLPPFQSDKFDKILFENIIISGQEEISDEDKLPENWEKYCKIIYENNYPYTTDIIEIDSSENDFLYFSTNADIALQLSLLLTFLEKSKSTQIIEFMIYGKKNNNLSVMLGQITSEGIFWK